MHLDLTWDLLPDDYVLIEIETSEAAVESVEGEVTSERTFGDAWLESLRSGLLRVPSAIIPESHNVLINPAHPATTSIEIVSSRPFAFDPRLWLPNP